MTNRIYPPSYPLYYVYGSYSFPTKTKKERFPSPLKKSLKTNSFNFSAIYVVPIVSWKIIKNDEYTSRTVTLRHNMRSSTYKHIFVYFINYEKNT